MKQFRVAAIGLALVVFFMPGRALAQGGGKGWLERLSGPGPFEGTQLYTRVACFFRPDGGELRQSWFFLSGDVKDRVNCFAERGKDLKGSLVLTFGKWDSQDNLLAPAGTSGDLSQVHLFSVGPELMVHLNSSIDVGAGIGFNWFYGNAFDTFYRTSLTPLKIVFKPLTIFGDDQWLGAFRLVGQTQRFWTGFTDEDFCQSSRCPVVYAPFSVQGEYLWSVSAIVDVGFFKKER